MSKVLIIGAGGVGGVVAHKAAMEKQVFSEVMLASRRLAPVEKLATEIEQMHGRRIKTAQVDADDVPALTKLIESFGPKVVINVALPYQDLHIMDACLNAGVDYLDTANYEPPDVAKFEYKWQWAYQDRFAKAGRMALLGSGFDPGVTNVFCAYARDHLFDTIETVDIVDCNAGSHGKAFATNFNPEINIREITQPGRYWQDGRWVEIPALTVHKPIDYPDIGARESYLLYHEELESLVVNFPTLKRARFWMTFGQEYLTHLRVLQNVGMTSIEPVMYQGVEIVPLQFLKAVLPPPETLGENYSGQTSIGCQIKGVKDGKDKTYYVYNNCDHAACYREVRAQAVSYTTGVPAMIGAKLMLQGVWKKPGVWNVEQLDPDPFMDQLNVQGLPWIEIINPELPHECP